MGSLPAGYAAALALAAPTLDLWLEVEGWPWAFGLQDHAAAFFAGRAAAQQLLGVKGCMLAVPGGVEQEARPLEGTSSVGSMSVKLLEDAEGTLLPLLCSTQRKDNLLPCTADIAASGAVASITVTGTPDPTLFPASGGTFYVGRETFTYTGRVGLTFNGVTRAACGSLSQIHTAGDIVSPFPRFVATRRAWLYASLDGTDANKIARWAGVIRAYPALPGLVGWEVQMDSVEGELKLWTGFSNQRRGRLLMGVPDATGAYQADSTDTTSAQTYRADGVIQLDPATLTGAAWRDGAYAVFRIDDEYICGRMSWNAAGAPATYGCILVNGGGGNDARGLFGTSIAQHQPGAEVIEVLYTGAQMAGVSPEYSTSQFTKGDHPLEVVLQLLLSRAGDGANGVWDVILDGRGLGIDQARVDVAGILALRDTWLPGEHHRERLEASFVAKEKIAAILRKVLCYPVQRADGLLTIKRISSPIPGLTVRTIAVQDVCAPASWEASVQDVYGRVIFRCDWDPTFKGSTDASGTTQAGADGYRQSFTGELVGPRTEAEEFYPGVFQTLTMEDPGSCSGLVMGQDTGAQDLAMRLFETVRDRYAKPPPIIGLQCLYDAQDVDVGDLVKVTLDGVPNAFAATRGLNGSICEVLRRNVDDANARVILTVAQTDFAAQSRLVAPSATVSGVAGAVLTCNAHDFTDPTGSRADVASFAIGDVVEVRSRDLATLRGSAAVLSVTPGANQLQLAAGPAGVVAGDVVVVAPYASQPAARQQLSAFVSPTGASIDGLGAGVLAHEYAS